MAFTKAPNTWFANWAVDGTDIKVPIASFPQLTDVEANGATGDIRKIMYAVLHKLAAAWTAAGTGGRPAKMLFTESAALSADGTQITQTYTIRFTNAVLTSDVADE